MSKNVKYLILGFVLIGMIVLMFFFGSKGKEKKTSLADNKKLIRVDSVGYKRPVNPSGTYLLYKLLRDYEKCNSLEKIQTTYEKTLEELLPTEPSQGMPNVYFGITENLNLNTDDVEYLKEFVYQGNTAFIAAEQLRYDLKDLFSPYELSVYYDTTVSVNFYHSKFSLKENKDLKNGELNSHGFPKYKDWSYFVDDYLNDNIVKIAYVSTGNYPICVQVKHGKGRFIFNTMPSTFSNINLLKESGKVYAENILSHFPKGNIFWHHDYGKYSPYRGVTQPTKANEPDDDSSNYSKSSPLQYILKVPSLFAALALLIVGLVLYMVFQSKRRQRIIPPVETNENSSVEFVETVSKLYFQQKRHDKLIKHKEQIFLSFIKHQYYISSPKITKEFVEKVSHKSGIEEEKIKDIFVSFRRGIANRGTSEAELVDLYNKLEYFYKNCK